MTTEQVKDLRQIERFCGHFTGFIGETA